MPIFALAPMEDVTDAAFREIFGLYGKPDVMFTEFVNIDGLLHPEGFKRLKIALIKTENQKPVVAQIWGRDPQKFYEVSKTIKGLGFDGIDINMGCPQDKEIKLKTCAALIREPELAQIIINSAKEGSGGLPVSVKTRIGFSGNELAQWLPALLKAQPAVVSIHARSKKDKSKVPADWTAIEEAVRIRDNLSSKTLILGNGDIKNRAEALQRVKDTGCDGVMIARGAFGNPWIFRKDNYQPSAEQKLWVMLEHARLFDQLLGRYKPFMGMRKNFRAYASGFEGCSELRAKLLQVKNLEETEKIITEFLRDINFKQGTVV